MNLMLSRRRLLGLTAGAAILAPLPEPRGRVGSGGTPDPDGPLLGDYEAAFEHHFGNGTTLESGLIRYPAEESPAVYAVRFTDDHADLVEVDLTGFPRGGLDDGDIRLGDSRFMPGDAERMATFSGGALRYGGEGFNLTIHQSEDLANQTGRTGNVMVMEVRPTPGDGPSPPWLYTHATVGMESEDVHDFVPNGADAVIGAPVNAWFEAYGHGGASQRALLVEQPPLDGSLLLGTMTTGNELFVTEIEAIPTTTISVRGAITLVEYFLPPDATLLQTFVSLPTATRPGMRRIQVWDLPGLQCQATAILSILGEEATGEVDRIVLSLAQD
ncbi:MAG TPA: hypothetical protein VGT61_04185 [Thermomicrobiales bacterium]|jgi:hypothetical protein|nr:hypothetical protein [Thermomicrobiales bacterium]